MASPQRAEAIRRSTTRLTNGSAWKASAATFGGRTNQRNCPLGRYAATARLGRAAVDASLVGFTSAGGFIA
jgi:hypothetical protein